MKKIFAAIAMLSLTACATHNSEGKMLDSSSSYCQKIRTDSPEKYHEICESTSGWKTRDPDGYRQANEKRTVSSEVIDGVIEVVVDETIDPVNE